MCEVVLDSSDANVDNTAMVITGCVQNGVVVLESGVSLPEGAAVVILYSATSENPSVDQGTRVSFPLVHSEQPGSIELTNDRIAEILDEEDVAPRR